MEKKRVSAKMSIEIKFLETVENINSTTFGETKKDVEHSIKTFNVGTILSCDSALKSLDEQTINIRVGTTNYYCIPISKTRIDEDNLQKINLFAMDFPPGQVFTSILTTHKQSNRQQYILETWAKELEDYIFYTDVVKNIGNQVSVSDDDTYHSNEKKFFGQLRLIVNNEMEKEYEWFFFCDDDTCVNIKKIYNISYELNPDHIHGKQIPLLANNNLHPFDTNLKYLSGGAGFMIHYSFFSKYKEQILSFEPSSGFSDVSLGIFVRTHGIGIAHNERFMWHRPQVEGVHWLNVKDYYTFHYVQSEQEMKRIDKIFKENK